MDNCILLEYVSFDYKKIGIDNDSVSNLKHFLTTCDRLSDFAGFEHTIFLLLFKLLKD